MCRTLFKCIFYAVLHIVVVFVVCIVHHTRTMSQIVSCKCAHTYSYTHVVEKFEWNTLVRYLQMHKECMQLIFPMETTIEN